MNVGRGFDVPVTRKSERLMEKKSLRSIPPVDELLGAPEIARLRSEHPAFPFTHLVRAVIADYRDHFYADLMRRLPAQHRKRLKLESQIKHQPFGSVRQDLNARLAQRRASQLVNCRLASIFARMGYPTAAVEQSKVVPVAAARINCQIDCLLSASSAK